MIYNFDVKRLTTEIQKFHKIHGKMFKNTWDSCHCESYALNHFLHFFYSRKIIPSPPNSKGYICN
jgi:hypothetical protein